MGGPAPSKPLRAFLALRLPDEQRGQLAAHVEECGRRAPGYRWVPGENLHLTLRFLGSVQRDALERLRDQLGDVHQAPFELKLDGRGSFGPRAAPRVVWLGVQRGAEACAGLAAALEEACQRAGLEPEPRVFRPHLTLARARSESGRLPELPPPPVLEPWQVAEFVLYESRLGRQATYLELQCYPLGPSPLR